MFSMNDAKQKLGRLTIQMNDIVDRCKKEGNRGLTSAEREKFHRMEEEYTAIENSIRENGDGGSRPRLPAGLLGAGAVSDFGDIEEIRDTYRLSESERRERNKPERRAFANYLRYGLEGLDGDERALVMGRKFDDAALGIRNTMSTTTGSQGGFVVPTGFADAIMVALKYWGGINGEVGILRTPTGNTMPYPSINDCFNRGRVLSQNTQTVETDFVFGQISFSAFILSSDLILIPLALLQDSYFDLETLAAHLLGVRFGRLLNNLCTVGAGTSEPTGIVTAAVAAGNVLTLGTGNTAAVAYSNLVDLQHNVDPAYRENPSSKWSFSDAMLKIIKKLVDGNNRPLWSPGIMSSFRDDVPVDGPGRPRILGNEYVINQDMAVPSANAYSAIFGDLSTYKLRLVAEPTILVLSERYADYLQKGMIGFIRADGQLVDAGTHPIAVLQQSAT